jgi:hypothetical protein
MFEVEVEVQMFVTARLLRKWNKRVPDWLSPFALFSNSSRKAKFFE